MSKTFLVTRPLSQGQSLCEQLRTRGFVVHHVPVMEVEPLRDAASIASSESCFAGLEKYHGIIVVSLNAAEQSLPWFARYPLAPAQVVFSVGKTTAEFLQQSPVLGKSTVMYPPQQMDSEGLLALPGLAQERVQGKHFLLLRGQGGRELIAQTLTARGAVVDSCELYRRFVPAQNAQHLQACLPLVDGMVINSGESLENFLSLAGNAKVTDKLLVVPGARVANAASRAGFRHIIVAANATDTAILDAISVAT